MNKVIYLSIALVSLSLVSCRDQQDMVQLNDVPTNNTLKTTTDNSSTYGNFNSTMKSQGDPAKPPQD